MERHLHPMVAALPQHPKSQQRPSEGQLHTAAFRTKQTEPHLCSQSTTSSNTDFWPIWLMSQTASNWNIQKLIGSWANIGPKCFVRNDSNRWMLFVIIWCLLCGSDSYCYSWTEFRSSELGQCSHQYYRARTQQHGLYKKYQKAVITTHRSNVTRAWGICSNNT